MAEMITINDIRQTGHCTAGARRWFQSRGLDFAAFLKGGISAETLLATGDHLAIDIVTKTRAARADG